MRTQTLLIASAVALAAAISSSKAQTVYSQNIVGYVNTVFSNAGGSYYLVAPLASATNTVENLMSTSLQPFDSVLIWNGGGYTSYTYVGPNNGNPPGTNWVDGNFNPIAGPSVTSGEGFFYQTLSGNVETNTWTGTAVLSNQVAFATAGGSYSVGSTPPIAGDLGSTNFNLPLQPFDAVLLWNGGGYTSFTYVGPNNGNPPGTNWVDGNFNPVADPQVGVSQAFFYQTLSGSTETWTQNDSYINP